VRGDCISDNEGINARDAEERMRHISPRVIEHRAYSYNTLGKPTPLTDSERWKEGQKYIAASRGLVQEDAFDLPDLLTRQAEAVIDERGEGSPPPQREDEYAAIWGTSGEALLVRLETTRHTLASFDTMADAQTAAKALNEHKGT
jgi:hypothetical protein